MFYSTPFILGMGIPDEITKTFSNTSSLFDYLGGNTGNLAFHEAIVNFLGKNVKTLWWASNPVSVNQCGDIAVIPCANHLRPNFSCNIVNENLKKVYKPMIAVGLGTDGDIDSKSYIKPSQDAIELVNIIASHSPAEYPNIALRTPDTLAIMENLGLKNNCVVLGCPSVLINPNKNLGKKINSNLKKIKRIAVLASNFKWTKLSIIDNKLVKLINKNSAYIVQHPLSMIKIARTKFDEVTPDEVDEFKKFSCSHMDNIEFKEFIYNNTFTFFSINSWLEFYRNFDFAIGARIHGIILALQMGIPALCIAHDKRTYEMCKFMHIPYLKYSELVSEDINYDFLCEKFIKIFDYKTFDHTRLSLASEYLKFFKNNYIQVKIPLCQ